MEALMTERRAVRRYELRLKIAIRKTVPEFVSSYGGQTRQVSTRAVYFVLEHALTPGDTINFITTTPFTNKVILHLAGNATVCRVHPYCEGSFGIAAAIEGFEISRVEEKSNGEVGHIRCVEEKRLAQEHKPSTLSSPFRALRAFSQDSE